MKKSILLAVTLVGLLIAGCGQDHVATQPQKTTDPVAAAPEPEKIQSPSAPVEPTPTEPPKPEPKREFTEPGDTEIVLFDGKEMGQWKPADYVEGGTVSVQDGVMVIEKGNDMTGVRWTGPLMRMNYELTLEAMRVKGEDFFCGLTFPYGMNPCTLVCGGWGGTLVGLSNIDYYDAANNPTGTSMSFENGKWYPIRLKITPTKIEAWIDGKQMIDFETADHKIGVRFEVEPCKPLGIATWRTTGAMRNMKMVRISE
jgi:hypothetical protein